MFIAEDEMTLVKMQLLGIQQYFIGRWCHQRLENFSINILPTSITNNMSIIDIKGAYYTGKHWWFKNWRMDDFSPNSPMLEPSKVSLHTVLQLIFSPFELYVPTTKLTLEHQCSIQNYLIVRKTMATTLKPKIPI